MKLYIYAKSSHRDTLDNVRRCAALANMLESCEPILCSGDYRAAIIARDTMDVKNTMGIDAMGNLPHTMERLDMLIYDNEDVTQEMHTQMQEFCTHLYKFGEDLPLDIVDKKYFLEHDEVLKRGVFFSDEDYKKYFYDFCEGSKKYDMPLLNGNYFFLDTSEHFEKSFSQVIDEEEYFEFVSTTKYLLCGSVHTCLEFLASGNKPVFFKRDDKEVDYLELLEKYNIPTAYGDTLDALMISYEDIIKNYPNTKAIECFDVKELEDEILKTLQEFAHIAPALEYSHYYPDK
nr:hypothetical protein [uncultured Sulfurimonas sp.]